MTQNIQSADAGGISFERRSSSASEQSTQASLVHEITSSQTSNHQSQNEDEDQDEDVSEAGSDNPPRSEPVYTTQELVDIILDFYKFLATLHYDPARLKTAPSEGWQNLTPEIVSDLNKSEYVIDLIRHIPYFEQVGASIGFLYKSQLCDIPEYTKEDFKEETWWAENFEFLSTRGEEDQRHFIGLAEGRESGGRRVWLNAKDGEILDVDIRGDPDDPVDIQVYFNRLKEKYRRAEIFPGPPGTITQHEDFEENPDEEMITEEQFLEQGPDVDREMNLQFAWRLYRSFGWPGAFRREECWKEVRRLQDDMNEMEEDIWEGSPVFGRHM